MIVYAWERRVQAWVMDITHPAIYALNIALAGEEVMTTAAPWIIGAMLFFHDLPTALLVAVAFLSSRHVEAWAKALAQRGRPRDPHEYGLPSGDCAIVTIWALPMLGWWGLLPIAFVMWARMALGAHWPLDTFLGVAQGLLLVAPALVASRLW